MNKEATHYYKNVTWWQLGDEQRLNSHTEMKKKIKKGEKRKSLRLWENYDKIETKKSSSYTGRSKHYLIEDTLKCNYTETMRLCAVTASQQILATM